MALLGSLALAWPARAEPLPVVLAHPPFRSLYSCTEHWAGQFQYPGDALGTDCVVQHLVTEDGRTWLRGYRGDGARNEDWYGFGAEVLSPCTGVVERVTTNPVVNLPGAMGDAPASLVVLRQADGTRFMVAHVQDPEVQPGEAVEAGQTLARVGNNGYSRHPHIHLGAWIGETPLQIRFDQTRMARGP
jgi:murein DD-endopeptidase MepM/ murein hydrolase activator NlpD